MMTEQDQRELERAYKDAAAKVAALPARVLDEEQQAEADNRECVPIQPLTRVPAGALVRAIEQIADELPPDVAEIVSSQRRACSQIADWTGTQHVFLLSKHLKIILDAAGFGPKDKVDAPV